MESCYVPILVVLAVAVGASVVPFSTDVPPPSPTTEDTKLVVGYGNNRGEHKNLEIRNSEIPRANLTVLTMWLEALDQLRNFLESMKQNKTEFEFHAFGPKGDGKVEAYRNVPPRAKIEQSLLVVDEFEHKIETELRKPEKDWNYSAEKKNELT